MFKICYIIFAAFFLVAGITFGIDLRDGGISYHNLSMGTGVMRDKIEVEHRILASGNSIPRNIRVDYYLSRDSNITSSDRLIWYGSEFLSSSSSYVDADETILITSPTLSGTYYIGCHIDPDGDIYETNESNNFFLLNVGQLTIYDGAVYLGDGSDLEARLQVIDIQIEGAINVFGKYKFSAGPGDPVTLKASVKNFGIYSSTYYSVDFYLSTDSTITGSDYFFGSQIVNSGIAGEVTENYEVTRTVDDYPPGQYYVGVRIYNKYALNPEITKEVYSSGRLTVSEFEIPTEPEVRIKSLKYTANQLEFHLVQYPVWKFPRMYYSIDLVEWHSLGYGGFEDGNNFTAYVNPPSEAALKGQCYFKWVE